MNDNQTMIKRKTNALGMAVLYVFITAFIVLFIAYFYPIDYVFWTYLFTVFIITLTIAWIIWYAYIIGNTILCILMWILGLTMLITFSYYVLETHKRNITVVIRSM
jgi:hypothetical protein